MHSWMSLALRHELLAASILWAGGERQGDWWAAGEGRDWATGGLDNSSRPAGCEWSAGLLWQCHVWVMTWKPLCCRWDRLQVLQLLFILFSGSPTNAMAAFRGKYTSLHAEAWHLLPAPAGQAALGSPPRVPSPAVPVCRGHQPCWVQSGSCADASSQGGSVGCAQGLLCRWWLCLCLLECILYPESSPVHLPLPTSPLPTPPDWAPSLKIGWEWRRGEKLY